MDQSLLDTVHKDYRRARAAALNMIPNDNRRGFGRRSGHSGSGWKTGWSGDSGAEPQRFFGDLNALVKKNVTVEQVNAAMKKAATSHERHSAVYGQPLVSTDVINSRYSSVFDAPSTFVIGDNLVKVMSWYDNESGYSARMVDLAAMVGEADLTTLAGGSGYSRNALLD